MANSNLTNAKKAKNDEFYTQLVDIEKELKHYKGLFRGKVVYCNCDDPFESNFFKYFASNFRELGLKRLIATSYKPSPIANTHRFIINEVGDMDGDGEFNLKDVAIQLRANKHNEWVPLEGNGDFRSDGCIDLLKQSDIVVTNPPFSLFREYVKQLFDYNKSFLIIGNMNAITYKDIFPLIKNNQMWLGPSIHGGDREFRVPDEYPINANGWRIDEEGRKYLRIKGVRWFTNLDHGRRHQPLSLMSMNDNLKFSRHKEIRGKKTYDRYDNYDAIEVPFTDAIPSDYDGVMGVPISFLDKYSPEQFDIVGATESEGRGFSEGLWDETSRVSQPVIRDERVYKRIFIKHKKATTGKLTIQPEYQRNYIYASDTGNSLCHLYPTPFLGYKSG